ncbi:pyridoxamine 5'-phosphate oxidase family protein [Chryseolinea sp. T2]|uniref:pyridoxamine 5'-phosphate oxidase family protein n=1 Tax=Chryseolinea sp. T2 TaxID=3129255 RepID=UPI0030772F8A
MLGILTPEQCRHLLSTQHIGRVGYSFKNKPAILPTTYVFDGKAIYCRSYEGSKIRIMRKNPTVCFQIDQIVSLRHWYSVLAWGTYDELTTLSEQKYTEKLFSEHLAVYALGETVSPYRDFDERPRIVEKRVKPVTWRIKVEDLAGRFEKPTD